MVNILKLLIYKCRLYFIRRKISMLGGKVAASVKLSIGGNFYFGNNVILNAPESICQSVVIFQFLKEHF